MFHHSYNDFKILLLGEGNTIIAEETVSYSSPLDSSFPLGQTVALLWGEKGLHRADHSNNLGRWTLCIVLLASIIATEIYELCNPIPENIIKL